MSASFGKKILLFMFVLVALLAVAYVTAPVLAGDRTGENSAYQPPKTWQPVNLQTWAKSIYESTYIVRPRVDDNYRVVEGQYDLFLRSDIASNAEAARAYVQGAALSEYELACLHRGSIFYNRAAGNKVAITFDDGLFAKKTPKILEILDEYDARATFFALGRYVRQNPDLAKSVLSQGSELGSHSWYHDKQTAKTSEARAEDYALVSRAFTEAAGAPPYLFRAPYGAINDDIKSELAEQNMLSVLWSVDTEDWRAKSADQVYRAVMDNVAPGDIILLHENGKYTIEALPRIIEALQAKGYELVTVSELIYEGSDVSALAKNQSETAKIGEKSAQDKL